MEKRDDSASDIQVSIERHVFEKVKARLGIDDLQANPRLCLANNPEIKIEPDFYSEQGVIGEIHAHIGRLKSAQIDKIASDILKMLLYEKDSGRQFKKYIVVCSKEEYNQLCGKSFVAECIRHYEIELQFFPLSLEDETALKAAMSKQNMT